MLSTKFRVVLIVLLITIMPVAAINPAQADEGSRPAAQPFDALTSLAHYFPQDAPLFFSIALDDNSFAAMDSILAHFEGLLPPDTLPPNMPLTMDNLLELFTSSAIPADFVTEIQPWMGDTAAVGLYSLDALYWQDDYYYTGDAPEVPLMLMVEITDREDAAAFVEQTFTRMAIEFNRSEQPAFTLFEIPEDEGSSGILVLDEALIISNAERDLPFDGEMRPNLTDSRYFFNALSLLPAEAYNGLLYVDTPMLLSTAVGTDEEMDEGDRFLASMMIRMIAPEAAGLTILDETTLVMDMVQPVGNTRVMEALGLPMMPHVPADAEFLEKLPRDAALVIHGTNLNRVYESARAMLETMAYDTAEIDQMMRPFNVVFSALTGLSYPQDMMPWLTGDYAVFVRYNSTFSPGLPVDGTNLPVDMAVVFEAAEGGAGREFIVRFARELDLLLHAQGVSDIDISQQTIGDSEAMTISVIDPYDRDLIIQILGGANNEMVVFGTSRAVRDVLGQDGTGFAPSQDYILENANMVLYAMTGPLQPAADLIAEMDPEAGEALDVVFGLLDYATISAVARPSGDVQVRFTLTLVE